ncbi:MAG: sigma-70 family RNA polymerase sigma factor [Brevinemataceae bacterium]
MNHTYTTEKTDHNLFQFNSISAYLKEIDKIPLLSRQEEEELTKSYFLCCQKKIIESPQHSLCPRCRQIKQKLITSNLRFVVSVAKKYQGNNLSLADLINEGNLGLLISVDKFDHTLGYHFISYAVWWIKQSIMKAISEKSRMIRLPMNRTNELFQIAKFIDQYTKDNGKKPTELQIEKALGINRHEIKRILNLANGHTPIEEMISEDGEHDQYKDLSDYNNTPENKIILQSLSSNIEELLQGLPEREQFILIKRFGLDGSECLSLSKVGILLGLTKERVRQLEKQALSNIKKLANQKQMIMYFN